jgi:hypothetical protein
MRVLMDKIANDTGQIDVRSTVNQTLRDYEKTSNLGKR